MSLNPVASSCTFSQSGNASIFRCDTADHRGWRPPRAVAQRVVALYWRGLSLRLVEERTDLSLEGVRRMLPRERGWKRGRRGSASRSATLARARGVGLEAFGVRRPPPA